MKEQKPLRSGQADQSLPQPNEEKRAAEGLADLKPLRFGSVEQKPPRPITPMQNEMQVRKHRGRLSRDVMSKLGTVLGDYYDEVRKQGTPDRFKDLLRQFDERNGERKEGERNNGQHGGNKDKESGG